MLVCRRCRFQRPDDAAARLSLCPRCQRDGTDVYLVDDKDDRVRRRYDLVGLLATARSQIPGASGG